MGSVSTVSQTGLYVCGVVLGMAALPGVCFIPVPKNNEENLKQPQQQHFWDTHS